MTDHRRRQSAAAINPITFASPNHSRDSNLEFMTWAEGIKDSGFGKPSSHKPGAWARKAPSTGEVHSDTPSPKLWEPSSPVASPARHQPTSREQTIDGYRKEMMELVRFVPESAYELSLKDLVELPKMERTVEKIEEEKVSETAKKGARRTMSRSESMTAGVFLLKLFLPFSLAGKRKSRGGSAGDPAMVSPKPDGHKGMNGEWWSRKEYSDRSSSSGSSSSTTSNSISTASTTTTVSRRYGILKLWGRAFLLSRTKGGKSRRSM